MADEAPTAPCENPWRLRAAREGLAGLEGQASVGRNLTLETTIERADSLSSSRQKRGPIQTDSLTGLGLSITTAEPGLFACPFLPAAQQGEDGPRASP